MVLYYQPFEVVFSGSWETDEVASQAAHQIARDYNCDIDDYPDLRALAFRKLSFRCGVRAFVHGVTTVTCAQNCGLAV